MASGEKNLCQPDHPVTLGHIAYNWHNGKGVTSAMRSLRLVDCHRRGRPWPDGRFDGCVEQGGEEKAGLRFHSLTWHGSRLLPALTDIFNGLFEASSSLIKRFALLGSDLWKPGINIEWGSPAGYGALGINRCFVRLGICRVGALRGSYQEGYRE